MKGFFKLTSTVTLGLLIVFALLSLTSCKKQQPSGPSETIYISVSPSSLNFGYVPVNQSKDMPLVIKNGNNSTGRLTGALNVSGNGFSLQGATQFNLSPGESLSVYVRFAPASDGAFAGALSITHNATNLSSPLTIQLNGNGDATINQIVSLIQSGWQSFSNKNYNDAFTKFDQAVSLARTNSRYDSLQAEAECGRGWSRAYNREFQLAKNDLLSALAHQSASQNVTLNSKAGLAFVHHALNEFSSAIQRALEVLNANPNYVFVYDNRVYHKRLRLVLAQSYYTLGDFQNAASQLDIIDPAGAPHSTDPTVLLRQIQEMWSRL
ncbi:choice-of-anchor D domain-containing protein [Candidatus Kryptobacter tengchongensis]|uniref:Abnormal spindle-like microcephaly-assoc'd, ASPM-SPD-2-Hydin n=1 Tax=Kryptobacter tengchongensis TaxID=1643429 RepID=A0A656D5G0_KRYT1|nr:choice-of-anchor D domain-containing protein [Candidatus Kryptobacter tengchongensis]CUT00498.1 Abnormal spindle-like microcephaly-assoc'd, ASPM-SPD-2-Hydin [Candidatus Kryptobacter tengchongensis]